MTRRSIRLATFMVTLLSAGAAHADMSCNTFLRGLVLDDPDVMAELDKIVAPLAATGWASTAMTQDTAAASLPYYALLRRQIARDCRALPDETVNRIAGVHLRSAETAKEDPARTGLVIVKRSANLSNENGKLVWILIGEVVNNSNLVRNVPALVAILRDQSARPLMQMRLSSTSERLLPGESTSFRFIIPNPPTATTDIAVDFDFH